MVCYIYSPTNLTEPIIWLKGKKVITHSERPRLKIVTSSYSMTGAAFAPRDHYGSMIDGIENNYTAFRSDLFIREISQEDILTYTCIGKNQYGTANSSISLKGILYGSYN